MAKAKKSKKIKKVVCAPKKKARAEKKPNVKKLPKSVLKKYMELLLKERERAGGGLSHIAETTLNRSQRDASGDLSGYSYHMADMASDDYEREFSLGRATDEQEILYLIDEAIKRVEYGTYGYCQQCNKLISAKRLKALPYSELCIECQKANEGK
ncbi:MAG: TraR/DksA C4-type zinc finger protein [Candidatus Omnitrophota bacterium]